MVSRFDLLYSVFLNEGLTAAQIVRKLGRTPYDYSVFYNHLKQLEADNLAVIRRNKYFLKKDERTKKFVGVIDFCVRNKIDYNELFLEKTIEFIEAGLKGRALQDIPLNSKTISRISAFLSKHGFLVVESRKPYSAMLVRSDFLELVVELFRGRAIVKCGNLFEGVDEKKLDSQIDAEFSIFKKSAKEINPDDEIRFIHRSLSLEGNTLSLPETERLIKGSVPPKTKTFRDLEETVDYKKALDLLISELEGLSLERVQHFHSLAMVSMKAGAGELRRQNVKIKGNPHFKTAHWKEIPKKLKELFSYYTEKIYRKTRAHESVEIAAYLHSEFQHIHPFIDGNSRTARAILIHALLLKGFPLITFPAGFIDQYMSLTKLSKKRNDRHFQIFMKQLVLHSLKQTNQKLKYA